MNTVDPTRCPICHEPNVCAMEKAKAIGSKPERCWCMDAVFTPTVMDQVPAQQFGNLRLIVSGLHERVNLISFSLAEVFVGHTQLRLPGQEALNAKHPQPLNHQLFKVALRA